MATKILLCEDSSFFAQAIQILLKSEGYEVVVAGDGEAGIAILKEQQDFGLILCDIMMPKVDGWGVANHVHSDPNLSKIPFIFLTGVSDSQSMNRAEEYGVKDYFIKNNVGMDKLKELVKKYV